jgi:hypothetical protein
MDRDQWFTFVALVIFLESNLPRALLIKYFTATRLYQPAHFIEALRTLPT